MIASDHCSNVYVAILRLGVLVCCLLALVGCGGSAQTDEPTLAPSPTDLPTATVTPLPSDTPTPLPTDTPTPTATPTDTLTPTPNRTVTAQARITEAASYVMEDVNSVLALVDLAEDSGDLAWFQMESAIITTSGYQEMIYADVDPNLVAADFVLKTDITWNSTGGLAGCGLIFRSEPHLEIGEQYQFAMMRLSGLPLWDLERWNYGEWQVTLTERPKTSAAINEKQGATNEIIILARGNLFTAFANGKRLSRATDSRRADGLFAFYTFQESGKTTCEFANTWVWALKP